MGTYVNPSNEGFASIVRDEYIDKTGIIALVNDVIGTPQKLVCVTRPRRFGKTFAAEAVSAYYSCGCDSRELFNGLSISHAPTYQAHLNRYNVVRLDMTSFLAATDVPRAVSTALQGELRALVPDAGLQNAGQVDELLATFLDVARSTGRKFVFVIDEYDAPVREARSEIAKKNWILFLRHLFKNASFTPEAVAAAYMTGILPIRRYGTQTALSDYWEYTMLSPGDYAPWVGFTTDDVRTLAAAHQMDMDLLERWYDGYTLPGVGHVYAPYSVVQACRRRQMGPYWVSSEAFESLRLYIDMDFDGLQSAIVQLLGGAEVAVDTGKFTNDLTETHNKDDVLTLLVHLGYLAYDAETNCVRVPNEEVLSELRRSVEESRHKEVARIVRESDDLLTATWDMDAETVAKVIGRVHSRYTTPLFFNNEQSLRAVVKAAYISAADHYARIEELPSGHGFADIAYIPRRGSDAPAMLVELKWNKQTDTAISQIRQLRYPDVLREWGGPTLVVGITYDTKSKEHTCTIEELTA